MFAVVVQLYWRLVADGLCAVLTNSGLLVHHDPEASGSVLAEMIERHDPDCIITDPLTCSEHAELIRVYQMQGGKTILLANEADLLQLDDAQIASANGILSYDISAKALVQSLRLVCSGERVVLRRLFAPVSARQSGTRSPPPPPADAGTELTPREREVLSSVVLGHSNKQIARKLGMAEATVKVHLKNLLRKIRAENRTQAAVWALSNLDYDSITRGSK